MNNNRLLIPESLVLYLLIFLIATGLLGAGLLGYYHLSTLEGVFGAGSFSALNLEQPINLLTWFFSVIWVIMVILAVMIISFTKENRLGLSYQLFWINVAIVCLVMSANSICSLSPLVRNTFERLLVNANVSDAVRDLIYRFLYLGIGFFLFVELSLLFRYIHRQYQSRFLLRWSFIFCLLLFGLTFFCCWQIPDEAVSPESVLPSTREVPDRDHNDRNPPRARGLIASQSDSLRTKTLKTQEVKTRLVRGDGVAQSGSFRYASQEDNHIDRTRSKEKAQGIRSGVFQNVSQETDYSDSEDSMINDMSDSQLDSETQADMVPADSDSDESMSQESSSTAPVDMTERPVMKRWEDLFGWKESLEEQFGLQSDFETLLGFDCTIEAYILGADVTLDLYRIRKIVRYGLFGFSLITLCIAFALVARGGRMQINQRYRDRFSQYYAINEGLHQVMKRRF